MRKADQQRSRVHAERHRHAAAKGTVKMCPGEKPKPKHEFAPMHEAFTLYLQWMDAKITSQFKSIPKKKRKSTNYHGAISKANMSSRLLLAQQNAANHA